MEVNGFYQDCIDRWKQKWNLEVEVASPLLP